ncbi:MAG TPA: hypothetical protein VFE42_31475 [Chloroflexota bacterium]|jgi:uncharacterized protein YunC (DUF1805 family)|nr:hypothetical protein [Chloroflexota bacterium]
MSSIDQALQEARVAGQDPLRKAALARAVSAVATLTREQDDATLGEAVAAASNVAVLYRMLSAPEALDILRPDDPLIEARLRGLQARDDILQAEGGTVDVDTAARLLGISRQAVDRRRRSNTLLGLSVGRRGYRYPLWQFTQSGALPGLSDVLHQLAEDGPWFAAAWLLRSNSRLEGQRPLDVLRDGNIEAVMQAARAYGEQGA